jgi:sarcosine oxidase subunit alpha
MRAVGSGISRPVGGLGRVTANNSPSPAALATRGRKSGKVFVDLQNDVSAADVALAARENYRSVEHLKRYTTMGMATDQGKTSNVNALVLMGEQTGRSPGQVGTTRFRPPFKPVTLGALAAARSGARYKPLKRMPGHAWHEAHGPLWEEFGGWQRPAAYPRDGESLTDAAEREARHVRSHVGLFEASPLGKIELYGPDAASFLDLMCRQMWHGHRRALLLREDGVISRRHRGAPGRQHFWSTPPRAAWTAWRNLRGMAAVRVRPPPRAGHACHFGLGQRHVAAQNLGAAAGGRLRRDLGAHGHEP